MNSFRQGPVRGPDGGGKLGESKLGGGASGGENARGIVTGGGGGHKGKEGGERRGKATPDKKKIDDDGVYAQRFPNRKGVFPVFDQTGRSWTQTTGRGKKQGVQQGAQATLYQAMQL